MYICTVTMKGQDGRLQSTPFFRFLGATTMAMPAGVPAVMIFCIVVALQKLRGRGITSLYPGQLKMAANVDIACFDKTGTLTGSEVSDGVCPHMPCDCTQHSAVHAADSSTLQHTLCWVALLLLQQQIHCGCLADMFALHCRSFAHADHALARQSYSILTSMRLFLCMNLTGLSALGFGLRTVLWFWQICRKSCRGFLMFFLGGRFGSATWPSHIISASICTQGSACPQPCHTHIRAF